MQRNRLFFALTFALLLLMAAGCGQKEGTSSGGHAEQSSHGHEHVPPHGGTAIVLGDEAAHLELVVDRNSGRITGYVMDGHLENFVKIAATGLEIRVTRPANSSPIKLTAVENRATGESVGNTSQFEGEAPWLKTVQDFDGILTEISIKGTTYNSIAFNFPKGNEKK